MDAEIKYLEKVEEMLNKLLSVFLLMKEPVKVEYFEQKKKIEKMCYRFSFKDFEPYSSHSDLDQSIKTLFSFLFKHSTLKTNWLFDFKDDSPDVDFIRHERLYQKSGIQDWHDIFVFEIDFVEREKMIEEIKRLSGLVKKQARELASEEVAIEVKDGKEKISKITFIRERQSGKSEIRSFFINGNFHNRVKIKSLSTNVKKVISLAEKGKPQYTRNTLSYINCNKDCVFYCKGRYALTNIVEKVGDSILKSKDVSLEIINLNKYNELLSKTIA